MPKRELPSLAGEAWLNEPRLQAVMRALNAEGETRVAGGCSQRIAGRAGVRC
jgi:hypothetical protein